MAELMPATPFFLAAVDIAYLGYKQATQKPFLLV